MALGIDECGGHDRLRVAQRDLDHIRRVGRKPVSSGGGPLLSGTGFSVAQAAGSRSAVNRRN